jgi:hypothetical protein
MPLIPTSIVIARDTYWCAQCRSRHPTRSGEWIVYNKGLNRRWLCRGCLSRSSYGATALNCTIV